MPKNQMIFVCGKKSVRISFSSRAWGMLRGPNFESGAEFVRFVGVYDRANFSVATGVRKGAFSIRHRMDMLHRSEMLLQDVERDADLLSYSYQHQVRDEGEPQELRLGGAGITIWTRPAGHCYLNVHGRRPDGTGRVIQWIDLRVYRKFALDDGSELVIRRTRRPLEWPALLRRLIRFLSSQSDEEVRIEFKE